MPVSHQVPGINSIPCAGVLLLAASLVGPFSIPAHAADDFYRTKPLTLVVGYAVGGGYDVYARLLARHLPKHIPGNPTIIVQNMPGAGSLTALRHQDAIAPKDGSVVTLFDFFQIINSMFDPAKTNVDIRRLNWLGSMSEDLSVCYAWGERGIGSLAALKGRDVVHMGLTAAGSMQDIRFKVLKRMLGVNVKPVLGYAGTAAQYIAIERGELDAGCGGWSSLPAAWRTEGKIDVLVRLVPTTAANMPAGVPYAGDLVSSERDKKVLKLLSNPAQLGKPFALSREVPAERVEILRKAFDAALHDPALLAEAEKLKVDISPRSSSEADGILGEIFSMPAEVVDAAKQVIAD